MTKTPEQYKSPTCWAPIPAKVVVLEKYQSSPSDNGGLMIGETFRWDYKTTSDTEARVRALRALLRDHPNENPVNWREAK